MRIKKMLVRLLLLPLALAGCVPEDLPTMMVGPGPEASYAEIPVSIDVAMGHPADTKAPVLSGADDAGRSGVLFLVFRSATGQLDSYRFFTPAELAAASTTPLSLRVPLADCDFYVLGNLMAVRRSDGTAANLMDALGDDFPVDKTQLEALEYRLDGGALNGVWRRETMEEVRQFGIPFSCVERNVNVRNLIAQGQSVPRTQPVWMFAKVVVKIDHAGFDGGDPAKLGYFTNKTFRIRQANLKLLPFSDRPVKAQEAADSGEGDRDPAMTNAGAGEYVFFVPENMQGEAPASAFAGESDAARKSRLKVPSNTGIPAGCRDYGSYVEFTGTLDRDAGGFGGNVTYQFYLGANETTDFNLRRGRRYNILLRFTADGLFHPDWRVQPDLTDARKFWITADEAFTTDIGTVNASRTLAVRKSRPGKFYLYMNPANLGGDNYLKGKAYEKPADFVMDDMADCAWSGDLMVPGTEDYDWLAVRGITANWDPASACLSFGVTDPAKFGAATLGETREFTLKLLPDLGAAVETRFRIRLVEDLVLKVADGKSLSDEFYLGQKRTVTVEGFSGSDIRYAAIQPDCGPVTGGNRMWKAGSSASAAFPTVAGTAAAPILDPANETYAGQKMTGPLDICAWYPNRFQPSHSGWTSRPGRIVIFSEDYLNDSLEAEIVISEPRVAADIRTTKTTYLPLDGSEVGDGDYFGYQTYDGSAELRPGDFDASLYEQLLKFQKETPSTDSYMDCVGVDTDHFTLFCEKTVGAKGKLEEASEWKETGETGLSGTNYFRLRSNDATVVAGRRLFPEYVYARKVQFSRLVLSGFSATGLSVWANDPATAKFTVDYFKNDFGRINLWEDHEKFFVYVKFRGLNFHLEALELQLAGPHTEYVCPSGDRYGPVYEVERETDDTGSGGVFRWVYDESHQVMRSAHGEFVPGGLLLPYGGQTASVKYTNKWDHREFTADAGGLSLNYSMSFGYFVGATGKRYASLYYIPLKNMKYLLQMDHTVGKAGRSFMLKVLGNTQWYDTMRWSDLFPYAYWVGGNERHKLTGGSFSLPRKNEYDVQYVEGCASLTSWSQAALDKMMAYYYPGGVYFKPGGTPGDGYVQPDRLVGKYIAETVPRMETNPWGPNISSGNGAATNIVRGVFVSTAEDFSD